MVKKYIQLIRKLFWIIPLTTLITGGVTYLTVSRQPQLYGAEATLIIGNYLQTTNPTSTDVDISIDLAQIYALLATRTTIIEGTLDSLGLDIPVDYLRSNIDVYQIPGTSFIILSYYDTDPEFPVTVVNALAKQVEQDNPAELTSEQNDLIQTLTTQINELTVQIKDTRTQLSEISAEIERTTDEERLISLSLQRNELTNQINGPLQSMASFSETIVELQNRRNSLSILEEAEFAYPLSANTTLTSIMSAVVGAALGVSLIVLYEYLDRSFSVEEEIVSILDLPVIASIPKISSSYINSKQDMIVTKDMSPVALESYRSLQVRLGLVAGKVNKNIYLVTSANKNEGKSMVAVNLAIMVAAVDVNVLLIDANMHSPILHEVFDISNQHGLSSLPAIHDQNLKEEDRRKQIDTHIRAAISPTKYSNLLVMPSGPLANNPSKILGSTSLQDWINIFFNRLKIDVILFDSSSSLPYADSSTLAVTSQAEIVTVIEAHKTSQDDAQELIRQFELAGAQTYGVVLNKMNPNLLPKYD